LKTTGAGGGGKKAGAANLNDGIAAGTGGKTGTGGGALNVIL
jgi:hypothetical protein